MKSVRYKGAGPKMVEVRTAEGLSCGTVTRGGTVDVPDTVADALVSSRPDDWEFASVSAVREPKVERTADEEGGE
jgi:hypothetical protein